MNQESGDKPKTGKGRKVLIGIGSGLVGYLLGIGCSLVFTPAEPDLAGVNLLPWYLLFSVVGAVLFFIILFQQYMDMLVIWWVGLFALVPLACELGIYFCQKKSLRILRPAWFAFPVGFLGTLGIYFAASLSV